MTAAPGPQQFYAPYAPWPQYPPERPQRNGVAVAGLVVGIITLLLLLAVSAFMVLSGSGYAGDYILRGTAAQVVPSQAYSGDRLETEIRRVLEDDLAVVGLLHCPDTNAVQANAVTVCRGNVDGYQTEVTVTFEDAAGHFELTEE